MCLSMLIYKVTAFAKHFLIVNSFKEMSIQNNWFNLKIYFCAKDNEAFLKKEVHLKQEIAKKWFDLLGLKIVVLLYNPVDFSTFPYKATSFPLSHYIYKLN